MVDPDSAAESAVSGQQQTLPGSTPNRGFRRERPQSREDGLDPRQYDVVTDRYSAAVGRSVTGLKIGVVKEGFGRAESEADVDAKVRAAADTLKRLGATVDEISIPLLVIVLTARSLSRQVLELVSLVLSDWKLRKTQMYPIIATKENLQNDS